MYELLINPLYLFLFVFYDEKIKPTYVILGQEVHLDRVTVSNYFKRLLAKDIITFDDAGLMHIFNPLQLSKEEIRKYFEITNDHIYIAYLICKNRFPHIGYRDMSDLLNIGTSTLREHVKEVEESDYYRTKQEI